MSESISICGFNCSICPAFKKNIKGNSDKEKISKGWKRIFGFDIPVESIECAGCLSEGNHPDAECPIRPCAMGKKFKSCRSCEEQKDCEKLKSRIDFFDEFLNDKKLSDEDYESYIKPYISILKKKV
jgi:NAD-dependent SIR2 family protein deacetylase